MGKRKSRTVVKTAAAPKVMKTFDCPFCSHDNSIEVKMERTKGIGTLHCRICSVRFRKRLSSLTKEVDIYCEWIDLAEAENDPDSQKKDVPGLLGYVSEQVAKMPERRHRKVESEESESEVQVEEKKEEEKPVKGGGLGGSVIEAPVQAKPAQVAAKDASESEYDSEVAELF
jgi:transcription elongation factor Elf1